MASSRLEPAAGMVNGVNRVFSTPTYYRPGSLVVFLNGQQLKRQLDNGWVELDPSLGTFEMKLAPVGPRPGSLDDPGDVLFAYYDTEAATATGGASGGVPHVGWALEVRPVVSSALVVAPRGSASSAPELVAPQLSAGEKKPDVSGALILAPSMIAAEVV